jgi:large subunit ribosomal protein L21
MYAVLRTGGKQYRVENGAVVDIEKIPGDKGASIKFEEVLLIGDEASVKVGQPLVSGASVNAEIVEQTKGEKQKIFKKIRRHGKQLRKGHRQQLTRVRVQEIIVG